MSLSKQPSCDFPWCKLKRVCFKYNTKDGCHNPYCPNKHICRRHLFVENVELEHQSDPEGSCTLQTDDFIANRWAPGNHNHHPEATAQAATPPVGRQMPRVYSKPRETDETSLKIKVEELQRKLQASEDKLQVERIKHEVENQNKEKELELSRREIALLRAEKENDKRAQEQNSKQLSINFQLKSLQLENTKKDFLNEFRKRCENLQREKIGWMREIDELKRQGQGRSQYFPGPGHQ